MTRSKLLWNNMLDAVIAILPLSDISQGMSFIRRNNPQCSDKCSVLIAYLRHCEVLCDLFFHQPVCTACMHQTQPASHYKPCSAASIGDSSAINILLLNENMKES